MLWLPFLAKDGRKFCAVPRVFVLPWMFYHKRCDLLSNLFLVIGLTIWTESSFTSGWVLWIVTLISSFSRHPGPLVELEFPTFPTWQTFGQHGMNFLTLQCNIIGMWQIPVWCTTWSSMPTLHTIIYFCAPIKLHMCCAIPALWSFILWLSSRSQKPYLLLPSTSALWKIESQPWRHTLLSCVNF